MGWRHGARRGRELAMSTEEFDEQFQWRETYFVLFQSARRPSLRQVQKAIHEVDANFQVRQAAADDEGLFESLNVISPRDHAALEIDYFAGGDVLEQVKALRSDIRASSADRDKLDRLPSCNARFEVMHFEEIVEAVPGEEDDEVFDPSALLVMLEALVTLTDGVGFDPQSGTLL